MINSKILQQRYFMTLQKKSGNILNMEFYLGFCNSYTKTILSLTRLSRKAWFSLLVWQQETLAYAHRWSNHSHYNMQVLWIKWEGYLLFVFICYCSLSKYYFSYHIFRIHSALQDAVKLTLNIRINVISWSIIKKLFEMTETFIIVS